MKNSPEITIPLTLESLAEKVQIFTEEVIRQRDEKHNKNSDFQTQFNRFSLDISDLKAGIVQLATSQERYAEDHAFLREAVENNTKVMIELQSTIKQWEIVGKTTSSNIKIFAKIIAWTLSFLGGFAVIKTSIDWLNR